MKHKLPNGQEIISEVAKLKAVRVGVKIPCFYCQRAQITVYSTKDVLCSLNGRDFGLCEDCYPKFQAEAERKVRDALARKGFKKEP